jgi:hypothetical protein
MRSLALLCVFAAAALASEPRTLELKPYEMIWRADAGVLVDLGFLLDKPAGNKGFVNVRNGHLADGAGRRLRIWGVNFSFTASLPEKELARDVAAHLARFGINCVRIHHLDWRTPRGLIDSKHPDSRHFDPVMLDRLDNLIAELKKQGVYVNLNLNVARAFQEADGVREADQLGFAKAVTFFDPRMIELQKEYAKALLTHKNPYTRTEYRHDPAVAMVEIVNENSLIESWKAGRLQGRGPTANQQDRTWTDIPPSYAADLTRLFNEYLARNLKTGELAAIRGEAGVAAGAPVTRLAPQEFAKASELRFRTEAAFYMDLESRFLNGMYTYLKKDLGVRMPVVGTSIHNGGISPYPLLAATSKQDIVDAHTYWQHPRYLSDPATGRRTGFEIANTPAVNEPERSPVMTLGRVAFAGKPFIVSEVNHPYPNEYGAEGVPLLAAYGALQDWDAIFWYSFEHNPAESWDQARLPGNFDIRRDPVKMTQWASAALAFYRGDIAPARQTVERSYTREQVIESIRMPNTHGTFFTPGFPAALALLHKVRVGSLEASSPRAGWTKPEPPYTSDTGQLKWFVNDQKKGLVVVNSDRWQALIGYPATQKAAPANFSVALNNDFSAVTLASLEDKPVREAARLLLTVGGRVANTGIKWNESRTRVLEPGAAGMMIEDIEGTVVLCGLEGARSVSAVPLDGAGRGMRATIHGEKAGDSWNLKVGHTVTPWYVIRVER